MAQIFGSRMLLNSCLCSSMPSLTRKGYKLWLSGGVLQDRAGGISAVLKQYMQSLQLSGGKRKRPGIDTPSWDRDEPASNTDTSHDRPKRKQKGASLPHTRNFTRRRSKLRELSPFLFGHPAFPPPSAIISRCDHAFDPLMMRIPCGNSLWLDAAGLHIQHVKSASAAKAIIGCSCELQDKNLCKYILVGSHSHTCACSRRQEGADQQPL